MTPERAIAFAPVVDPETRLLILGSLPGVASLAARQYYAHPRNGFWRLIGAVIEADLGNLPYPQRLDALIRARVGLWDTVASATRLGSLDTAIRDVREADLDGLVARLPNLRAIGFNGAKAAKIGRSQLSAPRAFSVTLIDLPSSSPAHARPLEEKLARWTALAPFLA